MLKIYANQHLHQKIQFKTLSGAGNSPEYLLLIGKNKKMLRSQACTLIYRRTHILCFHGKDSGNYPALKKNVGFKICHYL